MPNRHKPHGTGPETGNDFIELAEKRGAAISKKPGRQFTKISTPHGSMFLVGSDSKLDKKTKGNYVRWFRVLGLMVLVYIVAIHLLF